MGRILALAVIVPSFFMCLFAQSTATISGTVSLDSTGQPMHAARVILSPSGRHADTDEAGKYEFREVPAGTYEIVARSPGLGVETKTIQAAAGATVTVDFKLRLAAVHESVTVTAGGREESTVSAIQSVATLEQTELALRSAASLGEVLGNEPGVAKRSYGPGNSRPVVRGFDGDRVLILEDGIRTGTLSSQSGDHGEPIDVNKLERLEVVRGPATLLYGSNAIGGVVNAVSRHEAFQEHAHQGVRGYLTGVAGSNNGLGGGSSGFEYGAKHWEFWASSGGQRTGDYHVPDATIGNSQTRLVQTDGGLAHYGERGYLSFNYGFTDSRYGIPVDPREEDPEVADLLLRRHAFKIGAGLKNVNFLEDIQIRLNYSDYNHQELVGGDPETTLFNKQFVYRTIFNQKKHGSLTGSFGFSGMHRDYKAIGEESLSPPTKQDSFSAFGLESVERGGLRLQFGGRVERNQYDSLDGIDRSFTGFSGAAGLSQRLWKGGTFVANYSHSYHGPHPGNLTFEIGNPNLKAERNDGIDFSVRQQSARIRAEANLFYYRIHDFVYLAPTGEIEDGLIAADYLQRDSRFLGSEARLDVGLHQNFWLNLGFDAVNEKLTESKTPLPRIPPMRGRIGLDIHYKGLNLRPELVLANAQNKLFPTETRTAGYATANFSGSYTVARAHTLHVFSAELFNAGDRLYRNHLSFIKEFAPEMGRGVRIGYSIQLF
jgi:iron complex outermembrane receptor protein